MSGDRTDLEGGCACRTIRYRMTAPPLFVHCCHCTWCQKESGSAFAVNAMIETHRVTLLASAPERVETPSNSGKGQHGMRCPSCRVALWSHYSGAGDKIAFVRVGTLDEPDRLPPDIHIFTSTKQPWVTLEDSKPVMKEYYSAKDYWPAASLQRFQALRGG